jgi:hypothetical protein
MSEPLFRRAAAQVYMTEPRREQGRGRRGNIKTRDGVAGGGRIRGCHRAAFVVKERMDRQEIIDRLRQNEAALRARGVLHAALFGSRARGDNRPDSDTDIMIDVDEEAVVSGYDYVGLKEYIASLFDGPVDVVSRMALKPYVHPAAADAVYAF